MVHRGSAASIEEYGVRWGQQGHARGGRHPLECSIAHACFELASLL